MARKRGGRKVSDDWVILRTSGRHTLPLAESLGKAKFDVWTPAVQVRKRMGCHRDRVEVKAPLLPTYVFGKADRLIDLAQLANADRKECPDFSVFHYLGRVPIIADEELSHLRMVEARRSQRKRERHSFSHGERVSVIGDGPWTGMSGIVQLNKGKFVMVMFPGYTHGAKIAGFLLLPEAREAA